MTLIGLDEIQKVASKRELKTLVIDVERVPGVAAIPFWGLSDYKNRRIGYQHVTEWPRTTTAAWRWFGSKKIDFAAEWDEGGAPAFAEKMRDLLDEADIITGHNVNRADRRWINSTIRDHALRFPSPYKVVDTLTVARRDLGDESLTLGALTQRYGIPTKDGKYDADIMRKALAGDKKAQAYIKKYNCADVEASTGLYAVMLPLVHGHPHVRPVAGMTENLCPRCGSDQVHREGSYSPSVLVYPLYLCRTCRGWHRSQSEGRGPGVRAI